ncbi:hypothetical protein BCD67_05865 [Oscillatoriales cyanobacterium USR001]|nr:hypothetical protein BCD67_05865 [Oscillatoriales cyanobacterium USR001]
MLYFPRHVHRFAPEENLRLSYVIWQEKVNPLVAVELLSPGTEDEDLGVTESEVGKPPTKWQVYEQILQIPYYLVFSRSSDRLRVFSLNRNRYREQLLSTSRFWIPELELGLGLWFGSYQGCHRLWLRWYDTNVDKLYHFRLIRNCIIIIFVGAGSPRYLISIDKSYKPAPAR